MRRILVLSHVLPMPPTAGQRQRVSNLNLALREEFHVTLLLPERAVRTADLAAIERTVDEVIVAPEPRAGVVPEGLRSRAAALRTGLKPSNYSLGRVALAPAVISAATAGQMFDVALFHYPHAAESTAPLRERGIPCVLDMHDLLWRSREEGLRHSRLPGPVRRWTVERYRRWEESAWRCFDGVIAISSGEHDYIRPRLPGQIRTYCAPMGLRLEDWPYLWAPTSPSRVGYYGGLSSERAPREVRRLVTEVMPRIWHDRPDVECWIVGSGPGLEITTFAANDPRVRVTGFVEDVGEVLSQLSVVVCPFAGRYGFRSRVIELLATGVPVVATTDAVFGMGIEDGDGIILRDDDDEIARHCLVLFDDREATGRQSWEGRQLVERLFSHEATYGRLVTELAADLANGHLRVR